METADDDDDLKLGQASASLLSALELALPRLLWRRSETGSDHGAVHTRAKRRDLDYVIKLIEPFQGEPQLLDARLKYIVPPIVNAYLDNLQYEKPVSGSTDLPLEDAICNTLYTLCKVRGYKVIVGFFNNEARHLELILTALERTVTSPVDSETSWQVHYVLLLWLSHLLLTPFDLKSISDAQPTEAGVKGLALPSDLPPIATRCLQIGLHYLPVATKAQDAAAAMLVRLVIRPDMQRLRTGDALVDKALQALGSHEEEAHSSIYERLGPLRFLAGIASSADLARSIPDIYRTCEKLANDTQSSIVSNAVAKKLTVKILRNIAILCLRSGAAEGPLLTLFENEGVLENVIDFLLRSLGDRDTPLRYAAAKALSLIVQELDPAMGHEVIQAILDSFKEDLPRRSMTLDFRNADPLRWHGLTLALAHVLFKRTASPEQLPDIINALIAALQFEQRTSTGSSLGTNVRDAANFGIWSFSRRYTTDELLAVRTTEILYASGQTSAIQTVAIQLILSACLDPAGNIRRGSSAALQELIGRHPNQVYEGITLVQIVEYQAVGLRRRAMVMVSSKAAELHKMYWSALVDGILGWRGTGSPDVFSREAAAAALAKLSGLSGPTQSGKVISKLMDCIRDIAAGDAEKLHGFSLALALIVAEGGLESSRALWGVVDRLPEWLGNFSPRVLRSELPSAAVGLVASLCIHELAGGDVTNVPFSNIELLTERTLSRQEDFILQSIPNLARALLPLKRRAGRPLGCIGAQELCKRVAADSAKSTPGGAGRAIALGALTPLYSDGLKEEKAATAVGVLASVVTAMSVDWRVIGVRALQLAIAGSKAKDADPRLVETIAGAVHCGLNDYTIDERGDVGSLVRLQAIACANDLLRDFGRHDGTDALLILRADIARLSLEKLERVRIQAAQCREQFMPFGVHVTDLASVSGYEYFWEAMKPLRLPGGDSLLNAAVLEGCVSCAGVGAEILLQASRAAFAETLSGIDVPLLQTHMSTFAALLKRMLAENSTTHAALELLGFLLDMRIPQRLVETDFKWRNLLSMVQKSHYKSNDIPGISAAVQVYRGLADVPALRSEVLKKLIGMLGSNPYPRIRATVAEVLFIITGAEALKGRNWMAPVAQNREALLVLQRGYSPS
ncbi:hypothetical protein LTR91_011040 [Friedmanniomyces endolithicus]|uniref:Uncharacterized protein n=1 Tax=Friedmanniomyces endolithicus TaxID=329885 RepID=A0A4U0UQ20_9PEZI|nr:hypothetical protein LTS09_011644 [Friedmanniomyces endolithicus]KAK0284734.1 hypothetical protein LTR35_005648 [Friedmanniomyces endolithicus]KAK0297676.1 hypothetical protein LTS00_003809 [Friedmanniomyces endolithicus]KAK0314146.1 hypothetical protein LTR82_013071 [Friedmanniomyces endolithicus]KAK0930655.1 hypothetical protein LTR57_001035 [Friedmanniomyces endolithicus]